MSHKHPKSVILTVLKEVLINFHFINYQFHQMPKIYWQYTHFDPHNPQIAVTPTIFFFYFNRILNLCSLKTFFYPSFKCLAIVSCKLSNGY